MNLEERVDIREYIKKVAKEMKEGSTTGNIATYETPNAFTGDEDDDGTKAVDLTDPEYAYSIKAPKKRRNSVKLNEVSYKNYKQDESKTAVQKINHNILEVNKKIRELAQKLNHSIKLKSESKLTDSIHWKRTNEALRKMHQRIAVLSEKANELYNLKEATGEQVKRDFIEILKDAGIQVRPEDIDYNTQSIDHYEMDVMIDGEPVAFDYNKGQLIYMGYNEEIPLGSMDQKEAVVDELIKIFEK